jgi:hypothetical protein
MVEKTAWRFSADARLTRDTADEPSHIHIPRPKRVASQREASDDRTASFDRDAAKVLVEA